MIWWWQRTNKTLLAAMFCAAFCISTASSAYAACSNPAGLQGEIIYNSGESLFQGCKADDTWQALHGPFVPGYGSTTFTTPGFVTFTVPDGITEITIETYGAGGGGADDSGDERGGGGGGGGSVVRRSSDSELLAVGGGGGGGGACEASDYDGTAGGGGGYAQAVVSVAPGEILDIWVGGGGSSPNMDDGGAGGGVSPNAGGTGGDRRDDPNTADNAPGNGYGGGGGGGAERDGGDSVYGGAGGSGDDGGSPGSSTNGGAASCCSGSTWGDGGGGGGYSVSSGTVITGSAGGAAANGGPGSGADGADGGDGMVVITCDACASSSACTAPTGRIGEIFYNSSENLFQGCTANGWYALHDAGSGGVIDPCDPANTPSPGQTCDDGSIYAGLSPDGDVPMYTTPADAPSTYSWNDGSSNWVDTAMANCTDGTPGTASSCQTGEANTALLVGLSGSGTPAPYDAAEYCDGLTAHGYDDWYLPAQDELNVLYTTKNTGDLNGTFDEGSPFPAGYYWSSSENSSNIARTQSFSSGFQGNYFKYGELAVRCVRKNYVACKNPTGITGEILYNSSESLYQGCTTNGWSALHQ